jgi:lipoate-protein ligase B
MIIDLGLVDYEKAYEIQKGLVKRRRLGEVEDSVILAEHKSVFTIGRTGKRENLLVSEGDLSKMGISLLCADRGGDITFHGPGQLVIYPIFDLKRRKTDLHRYLRDLETVCIDFLRQYSIQGGRVVGRTGVWIHDKKVCSIGIGASDWVTYHGMAVNINVDLRFFRMINPCGMKDAEVTSMNRVLSHDIRMGQAKERMLAALESVFNIKESAGISGEDGIGKRYAAMA